jgi:hypothetical protein
VVGVNSKRPVSHLFRGWGAGLFYFWAKEREYALLDYSSISNSLNDYGGLSDFSGFGG